MDFQLKKIENIDRETFNWSIDRDKTSIPSVAVSYNSSIYQISNFSDKKNIYLYKDIDSIKEILDMSISLYSSIKLSEIGNIIKICNKFSINPISLDFIKKVNLKGNKIFNTIEKIPSYPKELIDYIDYKNVPSKILILLSTFNNKQLSFITDFIKINNPPLQSFKQFIEEVADFPSLPETISYTKEFNFPDRRSQQHKDLDNKLINLNSLLSEIKISSIDNFETGRLNINFSFQTESDFILALKNINTYKDDIVKFINRIKEYDIY